MSASTSPFLIIKKKIYRNFILETLKWTESFKKGKLWPREQSPYCTFSKARLLVLLVYLVQPLLRKYFFLQTF